MSIKRIISAFLTLVMLVSSLVVSVDAAWADKVDEEGNPLIDYTSKVYESPEAKLEDMTLITTEYGYELWYEEFTGEVAIRDLESGLIYTTNPWDVTNSGSRIGKQNMNKLLSQIVVTYSDSTGSGLTLTSYEHAALLGQIQMKRIKGGIRVQYAIGLEDTKILVPRMIRMSTFEEEVLSKITDPDDYRYVYNMYQFHDSESLDLNNPVDLRKLESWKAMYPSVEKMSLAVIDVSLTNKILRKVESIIRKYCPDFTYDALMEYHMEAEYDGVDAASPRFKMALEYTLTDDGLDVRLPANSIAFDETKFTLESISVLPYFGAGSNKYEGYSLLPDGSGTLVTFSDTINRAIMIQGDMYGPDYVYRKLGNLANETFRMPVFGTVTNYDYTVKGVQRKYSSGVFAVITEGDSLSTIKSESGGALHPYTSSYVMFNPRPRDTIKLFSTESGAGASMSVTTTRIFTGSYRIKYTFLIDDAIAKKNKIEDTYSPTWLGMANAYRDYLMKEGILTKLTEEDVKENIPLYIESFGSTTDDDRMFTFPVVVDVPLTTFEDVKTMQSELSSKGISNINFKLKGFYNGGMWPTIPYKLKFDKVVGGDEGFADLVEYAKENDFMVYPDFDLANSMKDENFDGFSAKKHAIRDVSDYICIKGLYDPAAQDVFYFRIYPITPKLISYFYDHFRGEYTEFGNNAISVGTLGTDLNSDFDEDEAYHREDGKEYTMEALAKIDADYDKVMVDGGNAYTMGYADVILGAPTTSSNFKAASYTVPFYGMVFHACKEFAGEPINMEGDVNKAVLNAIESGAGIYFILSYRNTDLLKEDMYYSSYYSVQYEIWKEDIVKYYNILNDATKDLQTSYIVGHEFLYGSRIPDADELEAIEAAKQAEKDAERKDAANAKEMAEREKRLEERLKNQFGEDFIDWSIEKEETETTVEVEAHDNFKTLRGTVVAVEYEGGVKFLLNYNSYDITVKYENKTYTLGALGFERID